MKFDLIDITSQYLFEHNSKDLFKGFSTHSNHRIIGKIQQQKNSYASNCPLGPKVMERSSSPIQLVYKMILPIWYWS